MKELESRTKELYEAFQSFPPKHPIVRNGQLNDAFVLLVFEILMRNYHNIKALDYGNEEHRQILKDYIVPPPDDSVDIFYEEDQLDEKRYHVVQVKNTSLSPAEIEANFLLMENSIKEYLRKPKDVRKNLREVIANTDFSSQYKE